MKEIGGYFELEKTSGNGEYYPDLIHLNTARNALVYLSKVKNIKKVFLPLYLCDSIWKVCERENITYGFYHVSNDLRPLFDGGLNDGEYLYIVNYFGLLSDDELISLKNKYQRIIVDNVQAFFRKPLKGIDTIYSCRKYFGTPDGAYLFANPNKRIDIPKDDSSKRMKHLVGRAKDGAPVHYQEFKENENSFYGLPLMEMSLETHRLLFNIDYCGVKAKREENFSFLSSRLNRINELKFERIVGPFAYPLMVKNAKIIRKNLIDQKVYVPKLWPNVCSGEEGEIAEMILPIPCDQRYSKKDMNRIIGVIEKCMKTF